MQAEGTKLLPEVQRVFLRGAPLLWRCSTATQGVAIQQVFASEWRQGHQVYVSIHDNKNNITIQLLINTHYTSVHSIK